MSLHPSPNFIRGFIARHGRQSLDKATRVGYDRSFHGFHSPDSVGSYLVAAALSKVLGKKPVHRFMRGIHRQALNADMVLGAPLHGLAQHLPVGRSLFLQKDLLPLGRNTFREVTRPSALAPATKASAIATPLIAGLAVDNALKKRRERLQQPQP